MTKNYLKYICLFLICTITNSVNGANSFLRPTSFPGVSGDATFIERTENAKTGYIPYAGRSAYNTMDIESEEEYINRLVRTSESRRQRDEHTMTTAEYCAQYPLDDTRCPQAPGLTESIIAIGNRPTSQAQTPGAIPVQTPTQTISTTLAPIPSTTAQQQNELPSSLPEMNPTPSIQSNHPAYNGPCTPPQFSNHFPNKILTTGRYAAIDPAFEKAMITVFRTEGECVNDPDDSGGYTCYGVSQRNNPEIDVRNITRADAEDIAYRKYYTNYNINQLPDNTRGNVFILGWGAGTATAIRRFCKFLGIAEKNIIDREIVSVAENYSGDIHNDFLDAQQQFYVEISKRENNKKYLKGWMNRIKLMRENGCHTPTTTPITR